MAKVLVVDRDVEALESLQTWLGREHDVTIASGVPEAMMLLDQQAPDVVIVDLELPPYRGDDFLAAVAENHPEVGRFLHTGSPGRALGFAYSVAHRVLRKRGDLAELARAIRLFLGTRGGVVDTR